jgi:hypothetical protein
MGDKTKGARRTFKKLDPGRSARKQAREQKAFMEQQQEEMARQEMLEESRIAEEEDRIQRKRARMVTGGRSLLIGTSPMGTTSEIGGGGMYG